MAYKERRKPTQQVLLNRFAEINNRGLLHFKAGKIIEFVDAKSELVLPLDPKDDSKYPYILLKKIFNKEVDRLHATGYTQYNKIP